MTVAYYCRQPFVIEYLLEKHVQPGGNTKEETVTEFLMVQQGRLTAALERWLTPEEGQDMIEYALLAALISIVAIAIIVLVGPYLKDLFQDIVNSLGTA